jgi:hypothetical protein
MAIDKFRSFRTSLRNKPPTLRQLDARRRRLQRGLPALSSRKFELAPDIFEVSVKKSKKLAAALPSMKSVMEGVEELDLVDTTEADYAKKSKSPFFLKKFSTLEKYQAEQDKKGVTPQGAMTNACNAANAELRKHIGSSPFRTPAGIHIKPMSFERKAAESE